MVADLLVFPKEWSVDELELSAAVMMAPRLFLGMANGLSQSRIIKMKLRWSLWFGGEATYFNAANSEDACAMVGSPLGGWRWKVWQVLLGWMMVWLLIGVVQPSGDQRGGHQHWMDLEWSLVWRCDQFNLV